MKTYEFICGGDHGAWECIVSAELTDEESQNVIEYSKTETNLFDDPKVHTVYEKIYASLIEQCAMSYYEIGEMDNIREEYAENDDESDEDIVKAVLDAQGFVISIPCELRKS